MINFTQQTNETKPKNSIKLSYIFYCILFVILVAVVIKSGANTENKPQSTEISQQVAQSGPSQVETYQKGLNYIAQKDWQNAAAVFEPLKGYKNSWVLWDYCMAHTGDAEKFLRDIPSTYSGDLSEEVLAFRLEQLTNADKAKGDTKNEYAPQKIVDSNGKQIWKVHISNSFHMSVTYKGTGNFIVKLSNSNQDLVTVLANEIGDYVLNKTVSVPGDGWYYLEIYCSHGSWTGNWN